MVRSIYKKKKKKKGSYRSALSPFCSRDKRVFYGTVGEQFASLFLLSFCSFPIFFLLIRFSEGSGLVCNWGIHVSYFERESLRDGG